MIILAANLIVWLIATEIIFFIFAKDDDEFGESFMSKKIMSMLMGVIISFFAVGLPTLIAYVPWEVGSEVLGPIVLVWYYGIISVVALFFGINYLLYKQTKKVEE